MLQGRCRLGPGMAQEPTADPPESPAARRGAVHQYLRLGREKERIIAAMAALDSRYGPWLRTDCGTGESGGTAAGGISMAPTACMQTCTRFQERPPSPRKRAREAAPTAGLGSGGVSPLGWFAGVTDIEASLECPPAKQQRSARVPSYSSPPTQAATEAVWTRGDDDMPPGAVRCCCMHAVTALAIAMFCGVGLCVKWRAMAAMVGAERP